MFLPSRYYQPRGLFVPPAGGGGGGIDFVEEGANAQDIAFGSSTFTASSVSVSQSGYLVVGFFHDLRDITSATFLGVGATKLAECAGGNFEVWAASVSAGTGNIVFNASDVLGSCAACWGLLINSTNTVSDSATLDSSGADPQSMNTVTIPASGIGIWMVGGFANGVPSTWNGATRIAAMEAEQAGGNTSGTSGAQSTTAGTPTVDVTGNAGNGWGFGDGHLIGLAFGV